MEYECCRKEIEGEGEAREELNYYSDWFEPSDPLSNPYLDIHVMLVVLELIDDTPSLYERALEVHARG